MEKLINILLVEDDLLDVIDIRRNLDKMNVLYHLDIARNGEEAIDYLTNNNHLPDITLIDLNMPKMNGLEFLAMIRENEKWRELKSFIITTSDDRSDKELANNLGISGYITKPLKLNNPGSMDVFNLMIDLINMKS